MKLSSSIALLLSMLLTACGGGGGGSSGPTLPPNSGSGLPPSSSLAQQCGANNPERAYATAATFLGSLSLEKRWMRSYFDENYLWRDEVPTVDPSSPAYSDERSTAYLASLDAYFDALRTPALDSAGQRKDRFSFTYPTRAWKALSEGGVEWSHGVEWRIGSSTPPRQIRAAWVIPGSAAEMAGFRRGDQLVSVDGISADAASASEVDRLNAALYPSGASVQRFVISRGGVNLAAVDIPSAELRKSPVPRVTQLSQPGGSVGYMLFNDHVLTAELALMDAIRQQAAAGVTDLVLDMRYNGGGYLFLASELAFMVAGEQRTGNWVFERTLYNSRRTQDNADTPFYRTSCVPDTQFRCTRTEPLPSLNLPRVYVLTSKSTCSASESLINGLRGIGVQVHTIGSTTCGKPYGFTAKDNCGVAYFPIEFKGVNAQGFGDFTQGFAPTCAATDDLQRELGDPAEGMLATALYHRIHGQCPPQPLGSARKAVAGAIEDDSQARMLRPPVRENKWSSPLR